MSRAPTESGFSLVEALVALAVFAMAGVGLVQLQTHSLETFTRVETRALADIAAQNRLTEIVTARTRSGVGVREEDIRFAGRDWRMVTEIAAAGADTQRVSVTVIASGAREPAAQAHGFMAGPTP